MSLGLALLLFLSGAAAGVLVGLSSRRRLQRLARRLASGSRSSSRLQGRVEPSALRLLCLGDSLTLSSYPAHLERLLRHQGFEIEVLARGLAGHSSVELLEALEPLALEHVEPDLVVLLIGTNDSRVDLAQVPTGRFAEALRELATRLLRLPLPEARHPYLSLCTLPPVRPVPPQFTEDSARRIQAELNPAIRALGRHLRLPVVELAGRFQPKWLQPDGVHPTEEGCLGLAGIVAEALEPWLRRLDPGVGQLPRRD